jgi:hypothetical protein
MSNKPASIASGYENESAGATNVFKFFFFQSYEETQAQDGEDKRAKHLAGFKKKKWTKN